MMAEQIGGTIYAVGINQGTMTLTPLKVTRVTAKRVFYLVPNPDYGRPYKDPDVEYWGTMRNPDYGRPERPEYLGASVDRHKLENAGPQGTYRLSVPLGRVDSQSRLYPTLAPAEAFVNDWRDRAAEGAARYADEDEEPASETEVKRLRAVMLAAHPDKGGTAEAFSKARKQYEKASGSYSRAKARADKTAKDEDKNTAALAGSGGEMMRDLDELFEKGGTFAFDDFVRDAELKESMRAAGYLPGHPVVRDEHRIIIDGHRRDRIARELEIEPETITIPFGDGGDGDVKRVRQAVWSNRGGRSFPRDSRQKIAVHMVARLGWTQEAAAGALGVSQATISRDLGEICTMNNSVDAGATSQSAPEAQKQAKAAGKRQHAGGAGRPRKPPSSARETLADEDAQPAVPRPRQPQEAAAGRPAAPEPAMLTEDDLRAMLRRRMANFTELDSDLLSGNNAQSWDDEIARDWPAAVALCWPDTCEVRVNGVVVGLLTFMVADNLPSMD